MDTIENLNIMHGMCILELQYLMDNIIAFERYSTLLLEKMSGSWSDLNENCLVAYDSLCSKISAVTNMARKFNMHFRLNLMPDEAQGMNGSKIKRRSWEEAVINKALEYEQSYENRTILPIEETKYSPENSPSTEQKPAPQDSTFRERGNGSKELKKPKIKNSQHASRVTQNSPQVFGYNKKDLSVYAPHTVLTATVTHIQDLQELSFFICEVNAGVDADAARIAQLGRQKHLKQYARPLMPAQGEIFGLVLDDVIVRAVLLENDYNDKKMRALLLDFGEKLTVTDMHIMYYLSAEYQQLPAQSIYCVLHAEANANRQKLKSLLKSWKYQTLKLSVKQNDGQKLIVKPLADVATKSDLTYKQLSPTNPFREDLLAKTKESGPIEEKREIQPLPKKPMAGFAEANVSKAYNKSSTNQLTPEELEMLYEEESCTSNAMKAVMGYDPKDDQRICRFYNPKTKSCFKGVNCRQEHTLLLKDGWTKDVLPATTIIDSRAPDTLYAPGTIITITPTFIGDLERFFCQLHDVKFTSEPIIFTDDDLPNSQRLQSTPLIFDLVLCRYQDGFWYRAKIIESDDVGKMFKVFYVDYGNHEVVNLRNLAKCDYEIAQWPFQAVLCRLADVRDATTSAEQRKKALNILRTNMLNKQLDVKVVFHREELIVRIIDEQCKNLPHEFLELGYFKTFKLK